MSISDELNPLTFAALRRANVARLPLFKDALGKVVHVADGSDWSDAEWLEAVLGELGEYANLKKKIRRGDLDNLPEESRRIMLAKELADVVVYLDILAFRLGIDLGKATADKWDEVSQRVGLDMRIGQFA